MEPDTTYSANLRILDNEKEIARLEERFSAAKRTIDHISSQMRDTEKKGLQLANSLGFETVLLAQTFIDIADNPKPYKDLVADHADLCIELQAIKTERDVLRANINASERSHILSTHKPTSANATQKQLDDLQRRYDQLKVVKERSDLRYAADYRKMKAFKDYLHSPEMQQMEDQYKHDYPTLSTSERKRRRAEISAIRLGQLPELEILEQGEIGPNSSSLAVHEGVERHTTPNLSQKDKENKQTPILETRKRLSLQPLTIAGSHNDAVPQRNLKPQPVIDATPSPPLVKTTRAPTPTASPRLPLNSHSINTEVPAHQLPSSAPASWKDDVVLVPSSSQTEDSYQDVESSFFVPALAPRSPVPTPPPARNVRDAKKEEPSQALPTPYLPPPPTQEDRKLLIATSASTPKLKPRPADVLPPPSSVRLADQRSKSKPRHSDTSITPSTWADETDERPRKMRRVSSPGPVASRISMGEPGASAATPLYVGSGNTPRRRRDKDMSASTGGRTRSIAKDRGKVKETELATKTEAWTPVANANANARASSSKQLADYSAYKGRGRYADDRAGGNTTINASFAIDPAQNGGRNFQYDEVVRGREDRRHLDAGDCECCRDYYAAIGPMPNRLQAPLWRTPPSSPGGSKPCLRNNRSGSVQTGSAEIASHKQAISRHRYQWARANTPPSYWSIGFPSTQEANDINEKARLMHQEKKRHVREEADRDGGRYKKR